MTSPRKASIGSISHGTLRTVDLLRSFADTLEYLSNGQPVIEPTHGSDLISDAREWADRLDGEPSPQEEREADEILLDISDALNEHAPLYCYFGTHEGDGSDFGFWPSMEAIEELPRVKDPNEVDDMGEDCVFVNDHGNVTVYGADGSILIDLV